MSVFHGRPQTGLNLTEVMIALLLLSIAFTTIITVFRSATMESAFTVEHYTAMFLAQKILEDVNARVRHNPHAFTDLISRGIGSPESVVEGKSRYFRLLDNTNNYGYLSEADDEPIRDGPLFDQLKGFTAQVSTHFEGDPITGEARSNLIRVEVIVRWRTKEGANREYRQSQLVYGIPQEAYQTRPIQSLTPQQTALLEQGAMIYLADLFGLATASISLAQIQNRFPDADPEVLINLGRVGYLFDLGLQIEAAFKSRIEILEAERETLRSSTDLAKRLRFTDVQRQIASLYEQKATQQIGSLLMLEKPIADLINALAAKPPKAAAAMSTLSGILNQKIYLQKIHSTADKVFMTIRFIPMSLSSAEDIYLKLVNPPYLELIPRGREPVIFRKVLDIQKVGVLRHMDSSTAQTMLNGLLKNIRAFRDKYEGRFPVFLEYLDQEAAHAASLSTLRAQYKAMYDVFAYIDQLDETVDRLKKALPIPPEDKKDKGEEAKKK